MPKGSIVIWCKNKLLVKMLPYMGNLNDLKNIYSKVGARWDVLFDILIL